MTSNQRRVYSFDVIPASRYKPALPKHRQTKLASFKKSAALSRASHKPVANIDGVFRGSSRTIPVSSSLILDTKTQKPRHINQPMAKSPINRAGPVNDSQVKNVLESSSPEKKPLNYFRLLPVGAAFLVLISGLAIFALTLRTNQQVVAQVQDNEVVNEVDNEEPAPSESEVSEGEVRSYKASPDMPKTIEINKINVFSRIRPMGLLRSGTLASPPNIYDTGWYNGSSKPGDGGAMLLVGHVHGAMRPGVFFKLDKLEPGDEISVTRGDDAVFKYRVMSKKQVPSDQVDMAEALVPVTPGKPGLNIITCAGDLIPGTASYADRIVLFAEGI